MDIRDVAKLTENNIKVVKRAVDEQAGSLCTRNQAHAITISLDKQSNIGQLTTALEERATNAMTHGYNADDMRMIAAYALAAAAWLDMEAAERGEGNEAL